MLGRPHHGGNLRHGDAKLLLSEDRQNIVCFQRKRDAQFLRMMLLVILRSVTSAG